MISCVAHSSGSLFPLKIGLMGDDGGNKYIIYDDDDKRKFDLYLKI